MGVFSQHYSETDRPWMFLIVVQMHLHVHMYVYKLSAFQTITNLHNYFTNAEMFPYKLQLWTGSCPGAGTNANVYMILHGRDNHTEKMWLDNGQRTFLPGQKDEFDVTTTVRVSSLESLTVGHDNSGISPGWFLDKVYEYLVQRHICTSTRMFMYIHTCACTYILVCLHKISIIYHKPC